MKKMLKRLCTGFLALATVVTALPTTPVHAESKQYWTESKERVGIVEKVMNDGSIGSTFNEGHLTVEGEDAYCIDINTDFKNGYKTRTDASTRMSADQISDVTSLCQNGSVRRGTFPYPAFTFGNGGSCDGACGRYHKRRKSLFQISPFQLPA